MPDLEQLHSQQTTEPLHPSLLLLAIEILSLRRGVLFAAACQVLQHLNSQFTNPAIENNKQAQSPPNKPSKSASFFSPATENAAPDAMQRSICQAIKQFNPQDYISQDTDSIALLQAIQKNYKALYDTCQQLAASQILTEVNEVLLRTFFDAAAHQIIEVIKLRAKNLCNHPDGADGAWQTMTQSLERALQRSSNTKQPRQSSIVGFVNRS